MSTSTWQEICIIPRDLINEASFTFTSKDPFKKLPENLQAIVELPGKLLLALPVESSFVYTDQGDLIIRASIKHTT